MPIHKILELPRVFHNAARNADRLNALQPLKSPALVAQKMQNLQNMAVPRASSLRLSPANARGLPAPRAFALPLLKLVNHRSEAPMVSRSSSTESTTSSLADAVKLHVKGGLLKQVAVKTPESGVQRNIGFYPGQPRDQASVDLRNELSGALALRTKAEAHAPSERLARLIEAHHVRQASRHGDTAPSGSVPSSPSNKVGKSGWSYAPASPDKEPKLIDELSKRLQAMTLKEHTQGPGESTA